MSLKELLNISEGRNLGTALVLVTHLGLESQPYLFHCRIQMEDERLHKVKHWGDQLMHFLVLG